METHEVIKTNEFELTCLGEMEEWVYDIEVDETHNFFANNILVHNSNYVCLEEWVNQNVPKDATIDETVTLIDNWVDEVFEPMLADRYDKLARYLNADENRLVMKREAIADCAIFRAKKNYIINVYDNEHVRYAKPQLKSQGIETKRTSTPQLIRDKLEECLHLIVEQDEQKLKKVVNQFKKDYNTINVTDIAYPRGVSDIEKWLDENNQPKKACPKHVRAVITYNNYIKTNDEFERHNPPIKSGNKMRFVDLIDGNPTGSPCIAFPDELPEELGLDKYVDRATMFEKMFMSPLESFTSITNMNVRHSVTFRGVEKGEVNLDLSPSENVTTEQAIKRSNKRKRVF